MKNKGFVLMETIVVIVVISVALLTIFSSYNKILRKVKTENKYDTSEYVYMTNYIKEYLKNAGCSVSANNILPSTKNVEIIEHYSNNTCDIRINNNTVFPIKKIYILKNISNFDKNISSMKLNNSNVLNISKNSEIFDAYMIDYLRKLDVDAEDELIIVEYKKTSMDRNYNQRKLSSSSTYITNEDDKLLYETYIASLEW